MKINRYESPLYGALLAGLFVASGFAKRVNTSRGERLGWFRRKRSYEHDSVCLLAAARKATIERRRCAAGHYGLLPWAPGYRPNYPIPSARVVTA